MFNINLPYYYFIMLIDLARYVLPKEGDVVKSETKIIIKDILLYYNNYPVLCQHEKYKTEENNSYDAMPYHVPKYMYRVVTKEHTVPPKRDNFDKCEVDWAGDFHFKYFDSSKNSDEIY